MSTFQFTVLAPSSVCGSIQKPALALSAARSGARGVLEVSNSTPESQIIEACEQLYSKYPEGQFGLSCQAEAPKVLLDALAKYKNNDFLVILRLGELNSTLESLKILKSLNLKAAVEVSDLQYALKLEAQGADILIAKGEESYGYIGQSTTFILLQQLSKSVKVPIYAMGGVGQHTVAAVKAAGASGVILRDQLFLAKDSFVPDSIKRIIAKMDGTDTTKYGPYGTRHFRLYAKKGFETELPAKSIEAELSSDTRNNNFLPLGQDAALAKNLASKAGTVSGIIKLLNDSLQEYPSKAVDNNPLAKDSPIAKSHGTKYPIVQGAMTRVSDNECFAHAVAKEGALPFLALSLMRGKEIDRLLANTQSKLEELSWGVGILGFLPQQLRQEQLKVIQKYKPPFALIAGGRPDQAKELEDNGTKTYLHVPSPHILKTFIEMGANRFVFEGNECGGHVGPRSSFLLWEQMIDVILECTASSKLKDLHILFAGGIHDDLSAKMIATMAAPLTSKSVKVGVLVGTAYLFTEEAVTTGAIVEKFQKQALKCNETVLLETGPGHAIRCIDSPYKEEFDSKKDALANQNKNKTVIKEELELMHLGRLRIASKGLERQGAELKSVPEKTQWSKGMYMIGQLSAMREKVVSMQALHENISVGGSKLLQADSNPKNKQIPIEVKEQEPVAIVGMSCNLPMSNDVETFWRLILDKKDAIDEVPASHWRWQDHFNEDRFARDKTISKWGGFIKDIVFDPSLFGIPPTSLSSIDPVQLLMLESVRQALEDAGYNHNKFPKNKTSMLLANAGHGPIAAQYAFRTMLHGPYKDIIDEESKQKLLEMLPEWTEDSLPGNLSNVAAGRVTNRFDLGGVNFCIDAACASSIAALYVGVNELRSETSDLVILGSADTHNHPIDFLNFSKTHALSQTGRCKTFDSKADGIVLGEGIATVVLKRLKDAVKDGDNVYALIKGVAGSSDGKALSLTAPRPEGQMSALKRAYQDANVSPATIGLVEAHGTGTVAGDKAEVAALSEIYQSNGAKQDSCAIGSVKTNIGHTKCSAGLASIIKVAKSLHHKVLPPTIGVEKPNPACDFENNPFYINSEARPWLHSNKNHPRRAAVSAFGFGGTNFHTVLEEYIPDVSHENKFASETWDCELITFRAKTKKDLLKTVASMVREVDTLIQQNESIIHPEAISIEGRQLLDLSVKSIGQSSSIYSGEATQSLAIVSSSLKDLKAKLENFTKLSSKDSTLDKVNSPNGIFYSEHATGDSNNKIAYLFPGQGSQKVNMFQTLSLYFPEIREQFEAGSKISEGYLDKPIGSYVYPIPSFNETDNLEYQKELNNTQVAQPAIGLSSIAISKILNSFGITPNAVAGHSYGEFVALWQASLLNENDLVNLSFERGRVLGSTGGNGAMLAVSADYNTTNKLLASNKDISIANQNSPHQTIVAGNRKSIDEFSELANSKGLNTKLVPVSKAFHSNDMESVKLEFRALLEDFKLGNTTTDTVPCQVYSNTTGKTYEKYDSQSLKSILTEHLTNPVMFADMLENMHADGVRTFIEVGPGNVLTSLADSILKDKAVQTISTHRPGRSDLTQLLFVLAQLWSNGTNLILDRLFEGRAQISFDEAEKNGKQSYLKYRINSIEIERIDGDSKSTTKAKSVKTKEPDTTSTNNKKQSLNQALKQSMPQISFEKPTMDQVPEQDLIPSNNPNSVESVLLQYQQNMLDMTNRFVDAQKEVMLAYLNSQRATQIEPWSSNLLSNKQDPELNSHTPLTEFPKNGNGNGNGTYELATNTENIETTPSENRDGSDNEQNIDKEFLIEKLFEIVSERTGYPEEMLDPNLDLEADLGIDSIKRIEIFNSFRKLLPDSFNFDLEDNIEVLAELKSLNAISDWIRNLELESLVEPKESLESKPSSYVKEAVKTALSSTGNKDKYDPALKIKTNTRRESIQHSKLVLSENIAKQMPSHVLILEDEYGISKQLKNLYKQANIKVDIVKLDFETDHKSWLEDHFDNQAKESLPDLIIHLAASNQNNKTEPEFFLLLTKKLIEIHKNDSSYSPSLVVGTSMNYGNHLNQKVEAVCLKHLANQGAHAGMTKTIGLELDFMRSLYFDYSPLEDPKQLANKIYSILTNTEVEKEVLIQNNQAYRPYLVPNPIKYGDSNDSVNLDESSLILVTGGARGITASVTLALAKKYNCNFVIVGKSLEPEKEADSTIGLTEPKDIKAKLLSEVDTESGNFKIRDIEAKFRTLLKNREIRENLDNFKKHANSVKYYSVDVRDEKEFGQLIDSLYEVNGTIDGVIHGAGIIEDAYIQKKSVKSFNRVYETKVKSALTLASKLKFDSLEFLYFFSSVVGRTGNPGQVDYVASNEALNKLALNLNQNQSCEIKSIMWGPWRGGMAPVELEHVFESFGWGMIEPTSGAESLVHELEYGPKDDAEVVIVGNTKSNTPISGWTKQNHIGPAINSAKIDSRQPFQITLPIDLEQHIYLQNHKLDDMPVLPMAMAIELILETAQLAQDGRPVKRLREFDIPQGVIFDSSIREFEIKIEPLSLDSATATIKSLGKSNKLHFKAIVDYKEPKNLEDLTTTESGSIVPASYNPDVIINKVDNPPEVSFVYENWMFHGPLFQQICSIEALGLNGASGVVKGRKPHECIKTAGNSSWILDPIMFDCAMQIGGVWTRHYSDLTYLPTGFKKMHLINPCPENLAYTHVFIPNHVLEGDYVCDLAIYDDKGKLAILVEGLKGVGSKTFNRFGARTTVSK